MSFLKSVRRTRDDETDSGIGQSVGVLDGATTAITTDLPSLPSERAISTQQTQPADQSIPYISTDLQSVWLSGKKLRTTGRTIQQDGKKFTRLDAEHFAWLIEMVRRARASARSGQLDADSFEVLRERWVPILAWGIDHIDENETAVHYRKLTGKKSNIVTKQEVCDEQG